MIGTSAWLPASTMVAAAAESTGSRTIAFTLREGGVGSLLVLGRVGLGVEVPNRAGRAERLDLGLEPRLVLQLVAQ